MDGLSEGMDLLAGVVGKIGNRAPSVRILWGVVRSTSPVRVTLEHDTSEALLPVASVLVPNVAVGDRVRLELQGLRLSLVYDKAALARTQTELSSLQTELGKKVPWTSQDRTITVGPVGDEEPIVQLLRNRPNYGGSAAMYLAGSANSTELAFILRDNNAIQAALRVDRDNIRHQDYVGGRGTRYVAFRDELPAAPRRYVGTVNLSVSASAGATANVSFPAGRFTGSDQLAITLTKGGGALAKYIPYYTNLTAAGMTVGIYSGDGTSATGTVPIRFFVEAIT